MNHKLYLRRCIEIADEAVASGNNPFGALLVDSKGDIIVESGNIEITEKDCTGHAETTVMRKATKLYSKEFLWDCTLYTTAEPCCMCTGAIYWGNVGRVVFGITEKQLLELTGSHEKNPTFDVPCREVLAKGQKNIEVIGPINDVDLQEEIVKIHRTFWK
ncbi:nucleoside deaminase [Cetobacterium sp.]|uniref:nucleoside deaminase n=1 Tax=Cetobacterium sp. TaxID=2071632 RepID=UPI0025BE1618|nr:nucleoside deaminase [Cetobacterium sp.]